MGRPSKNGRFVNFLIPKPLLAELETVASIMGITKTAVLEHAMQEYFEPFHNASGEINAVEATYVPEGKPCFVLDTITMQEKKHYRIFFGGDIITVPARDIVLPK